MPVIDLQIPWNNKYRALWDLLQRTAQEVKELDQGNIGALMAIRLTACTIEDLANKAVHYNTRIARRIGGIMIGLGVVALVGLAIATFGFGASASGGWARVCD